MSTGDEDPTIPSDPKSTVKPSEETQTAERASLGESLSAKPQPLALEPPLLSDEDEDAIHETIPSTKARPAAEPSAPKRPRPVDTTSRPMVRSTRFEWPLGIAGAATMLFAAACIAAQSGLMQPLHMASADPEVTVPFLARVVVFLKGLVFVLLSSGCLVAGAYILHLLERRPLGDVRVLSARMLAVGAIAILARMLPIPASVESLKPFYDALAPLAAMWLLLMPTFRMGPRESGIAVGGAMLALIVIKFGSAIVTFAV